MKRNLKYVAHCKYFQLKYVNSTQNRSKSLICFVWNINLDIFQCKYLFGYPNDLISSCFNRFQQLSFAWLVLLLKLLGGTADDMTTIIMDTDIGQKDGQKIYMTVTNLIHGIITTIGEPLVMLWLNKVWIPTILYSIWYSWL